LPRRGSSWDIVIVGAGSAGLMCAISAAASGAEVAVIERSSQIGGSLLVASGKMSAAGTRRQRERAIHDSPDRHFADVMRLSNGTADPVIVRRAVDEAAGTLDWLDELGFPFDEVTPAYDAYHEHAWLYSAPRTVWGPGPESLPGMARTVLETIRPVWDRHVRDGDIRLFAGHELNRLELVEDGIEAHTDPAAGGFRAPAVVLATGGYGASPSLFAQLTPGAPVPVALSSPTSRGGGIVAAMGVGAAVRNADMYRPRAAVFESAVGSGTAVPGWVDLTSSDREPREIQVGADGRRFRAEDDRDEDELNRTLAALPGHALWLVFDEAARLGGPSFHSTHDADALLRAAEDEAYVWRADTIEDLAQRAGIAASGLRDTAASWNGAVATGVDTLGRVRPAWALRQPPFYAARVRPTVLATAGGLTVDEHLRVLDRHGSALPGLYAVGEILGAGATMGNASCSGMMVTPALSLGRALGLRLARDVAGSTRAGSGSHAP
jgi:fumarate reductase flavoprotein subunit